jgi:hypothetical protein
MNRNVVIAVGIRVHSDSDPCIKHSTVGLQSLPLYVFYSACAAITAQVRVKYSTLNSSRSQSFSKKKRKEKVYFPHFHESPLFLPQLQNRANHLPQLFKPCILPPWSGFEGGFATVNGGFATVRRFVFFFFYLFRPNL